MDITLYSSPTCPKCKVIEMKLEQKGYSFIKITDPKKLEAKGFKSVPWLEVNGELFDFGAANNWVNSAPEVI